MLAQEVDTLAQLFLRRVEVTPTREAYRRKIDGRWVGTTWSAFAQDVQRVAAGLLEDGLERGDRIAIIGGCRISRRVRRCFSPRPMSWNSSPGPGS